MLLYYFWSINEDEDNEDLKSSRSALCDDHVAGVGWFKLSVEVVSHVSVDECRALAECRWWSSHDEQCAVEDPWWWYQYIYIYITILLPQFDAHSII